jgi:hypothetical protein
MAQRGRPKGIEFDPDFVTDISEQIVIGFYNDFPERLKERMRRDPELLSMLRQRANKRHGSMVRSVLRAISTISDRSSDRDIEGRPVSQEEYQREICYLVYLDQLEEPKAVITKRLEEGAETIWRERATLYAVSVSLILAARERVMAGTPLKLKRPPLVNLDDDEGDDAFA